MGMERKPYPTDLNDFEWRILKPLVPAAKPGGRPRSTNIREVLNAIFYVLRSGCAWRIDGVREQINKALRIRLRKANGREAEPSAAILDSQSVKTTETKGIRAPAYAGAKESKDANATSL